jgi:hypothetical protein
MEQDTWENGPDNGGDVLEVVTYYATCPQKIVNYIRTNRFTEGWAKDYTGQIPRTTRRALNRHISFASSSSEMARSCERKPFFHAGRADACPHPLTILSNV